MLELYQFESCTPCGRVRRKLQELNLDWVSRTVQPHMDKRDRVIAISGQPLVPVLVDGANKMIVTEADDICAYLDETFGPKRAPEREP